MSSSTTSTPCRACNQGCNEIESEMAVGTGDERLHDSADRTRVGVGSKGVRAQTFRAAQPEAKPCSGLLVKTALACRPSGGSHQWHVACILAGR
jgi:hypothetical protein